MRVLVAGATGAIGVKLVAAGLDVVGLIRTAAKRQIRPESVLPR